MRKEEFLEKLRARLSQTMSQQEVTAQIRYYENYIQEQIQNGRSEEEVLTELGDPLLIAKTLVDVQETQEEYSHPETNVYEERGGQESGDAQRELHRMEIKTRGGCLLAAVIFVVVVAMIFHVQADRSLPAGRSICPEYGCEYSLFQDYVDTDFQCAFCMCDCICRTNFFCGNCSSISYEKSVRNIKTDCGDTGYIFYRGCILYDL